MSTPQQEQRRSQVLQAPVRGACNGWQTCLDGEGRLHLYGVAEDLGITGLSADEWHTSEWIGFFFLGGGLDFVAGIVMSGSFRRMWVLVWFPLQSQTALFHQNNQTDPDTLQY